MEKWSCRNPLSIDDRKFIQHGITSGMSSREIGKEIGRCKSVVLRESKRLGDIKNYDAEMAQHDFEKKQREGWKKCSETQKSKRFSI